MSTLSTIAYDAYKLAFEKSPIFLNGGIVPEALGALPILAITEGLNVLGSAALALPSSLSPSSAIAGAKTTLNNVLNPDSYFASFMPIPGGTLNEYQLGIYPYANQQTAANSVIAQPLKISMAMECHPRRSGAMWAKIAIMTALKNVIDNHVLRGGTFTVLTPAYTYIGCVLLMLKDTSTGDSKHPQSNWQWDFEQPLISLQAATFYENSLMNKISGGHPTGVLWSGIPGL